MKEKKEISAGRAKETKIKALEMTVEESTENVFPGTVDRESLKSQKITVKKNSVN